MNISRIFQALGFGLLYGGLLIAVPSAFAQSYSRTDKIAYEDNLSLWVIGQRQTSTNVETGVVESRTVYDPVTALPVETYAFEKLQQRMTYNADGTLASTSDGRDTSTYNTTVTLSNWKRGIPQAIGFPDGTSQSAVVDDLGQITSITDEVGARTCYQFDAMGRLSRITYPSESQTGVCEDYNATSNPSGWNPTILSFVPVSTAEYGIAAGHWKQTVTTGNGVKVSYFDALWRPLVVESYDASNAAATRSVSVTRYDADGRAVYQSYPVASLTDFATSNQGTRTTYDALGRPTRVEQDSELGVLAATTAYLTGFQTQVTNPRGKVTTTAYMTYDQPTTDWPVAITHPEGAYTNIFRDVFGKPTTLVRNGANNSPWNGRYYIYNDFQELCKRVELETGTTVMSYDTAGNLEWSASGLPWSSTTDCTSADPTSRKVVRAYDQRNRLTTLTFPDGIGDQVWSYTDDGLPSQIITYNGANHTIAAINAYSYNNRRLLGGQGESISQDGWYTWGFGYGYDANGNLSAHVYPGSLTVDYAPNALGQPAKAGTFATGVSYHPNGAVKQFTYGNGIVHTMTQNARLLPDVSRDAYGTMEILDDGYDYDQNGNVAAISDGASLDGHGNRTMLYDDLDRLKSATSTGMFGGTVSYTYDVLDNIVTLVGPGRNLRYCYDAGFHLTFIRSGSTNCSDGAATTSLTYDVQGNLKTKNAASYTFDYGNRLRSVTGLEAYRYDGYGRRILAWSAQGLGNILSMYSQDGALRFQSDGRRGKAFQHIYLAGSLVAEREYPLAGGTASVKYQHTDALGTPVVVTDASRNVIERVDYEPYGKRLTGTAQDRPGYTGHVEDAATGLTYMQQRYYDPGIGRFLSVDPVTANPKNGTNFNRYWYANNNPYRFTDPDGRYTCGGDKAFCAKVDSYVSALKDSARSLRAGGAAKKDEYQRVSAALTQIGKKGEGGPRYVPGTVDGRGSAKTDQRGTTTVETAKIADAKLGAQNLAHEATHDIDVQKGGVKTTEAQVRETETNAYSASRAVDMGFGKYWTETQFQNAVQDSVDLWKNANGDSDND